MATGDADDFAWRLRRVLPTGWFPDSAPTLDTILQGMGTIWAALYNQLAFVRAQARIATSTGIWLDMAATDFLGRFPRRLNEPDASYSLRIRREIVRPRNTRSAIIQVLQDLTGNTPTAFRPTYSADTGGIGTYSMGIGVAGRIGSLSYPFQGFVQIQRGTASASNTSVSYGGPIAGIGTTNAAIGGGQSVIGSGIAQGGVTDADIYAAVASVTPAGHINWVAISD